ncbi:hypothetical protein NDU88_005386 [Pleurodeles waltl]|uniref:Uncharacterized protein n=1 Tax=Pleurodeles waltl TaxID=8319 RepID=A0AAV7TU36_PLEWA|nr:hypothetical protein NDU88_005386 [Pleurodeles waltl]
MLRPAVWCCRMDECGAGASGLLPGACCVLTNADWGVRRIMSGELLDLECKLSLYEMDVSLPMAELEQLQQLSKTHRELVMCLGCHDYRCRLALLHAEGFWHGK